MRQFKELFQEYFTEDDVKAQCRPLLEECVSCLQEKGISQSKKLVESLEKSLISERFTLFDKSYHHPPTYIRSYGRDPARSNFTIEGLCAHATGAVKDEQEDLLATYFPIDEKLGWTGAVVGKWRSPFVIPYDSERYSTEERVIEATEGDDVICRLLNITNLKHLEIDLQVEIASLVWNKPTIGLIQLCEALSGITKQSISYDLDKLEYWQRNPFGRVEGECLKSLVEEAKRNYVPSRLADKRGNCIEQGDRFRNLLGIIGLPKNFKYLSSGCRRPVTENSDIFIRHNLTMVIDTDRSSWFFVNSLSPTQPLNVIPKEDLPKFGFKI